ncbi:fatty acid desaturase [Roseibium sp. AS2]|uniref:fatty acid desaturase n=1 Tax=Roseibium sp. AS2 TaxID=3135781 RepID=UPI00316F77E8
MVDQTFKHSEKRWASPSSTIAPKACRGAAAPPDSRAAMTAVPNTQADFFRIDCPDPHKQRRTQILTAHPEIRHLFGPEPRSALLVAGLVLLHFSMAFLLRDAPVWLLAGAAYCVGAYVSASLYALIHDAAHGLIFRRRNANRIVAILANTPLVIVSAESFRRYHYWHHANMGDYRQDVGIPTRWEASWVGNSTWRKAVWLTFFVVFQAFRTAKFSGSSPFFTKWMTINVVVQLAVDVVIVWLLGPGPLLYLFLSFFFAFSLHPLGARVLQEHLMVEDGQETNNFTGPSNILECNFGCHNEHHDFPGIPWSRLPSVSRIAPEFYEPLHAFTSRWKLIRAFIFDPQWDLFHHAVRNAPEQ